MPSYKEKKKKFAYGRLKDETFVFDDESKVAIEKEQKPGIGLRLYSFFTSRYMLITMIILIFGVLIFLETAKLQLNPTSAAGISESVGVPRQQTIKAARGDIIDASGLPLAWTEPSNKLFLTYAGLDAEDLNQRLLDLSYFLESNNIEPQINLTDYLDLEFPRGAASLDEAEGVPVWQDSLAEILFWQKNRNLFNLRDVERRAQVRYDDRYVKINPEVFFDYLLYELFKIEDPATDGQVYSQADAFRIMKLRYLIFENNWAFINGTPVELARDIPDEVIHIINEQNYRFMGVISSRETERVYSDLVPDIGHVMGYVGRITARQYNEMQHLGYAPDAMVGQAGVEAIAERYLAGQDGVKPYNIWTVAEDEGMFYSENIGKDPVPGNHVRLTLDMELQQVALRSLERVIDEIRHDEDADAYRDADAGSVVMIDVNTGEVLAMASYPGYDPNDFLIQGWDADAADRIQEYLTDDHNKPLSNRTISEIYAPGSTFKAVTAVAALESGTISPFSSTYECTGTMDIGGLDWSCLSRPRTGHGNLALTRGMATSCNLYFFQLGVDTTINQIDAWGRKLGLGEQTGIDLPGEVLGYRASRETHSLIRVEERDWSIADTCQASIGQSYNSYTILQLAVYTASLATGYRVTPYVIADVTRPDGTIVFKNEPQRVHIGMQQSTLDVVRESMLAVTATSEGTASDAFEGFPIPVAAKTGTAETGHEDFSSSNGLFIAYAPADNPQVAVAQIIEKGRWGSNTIAIARDLFEAYFNLDSSSGPGDELLQPGWLDPIELDDQETDEDENEEEDDDDE